MTLKHTPGPWKVSRADLTAQGFGYCRFVRTVNKSPMDVAEHICHVCELGDAAEDSANARLISAAPDLLAALQGLLSDKYLSDPINNDRMAAARAAVSKATGE